jgi:hypothetical protein
MATAAEFKERRAEQSNSSSKKTTNVRRLNLNLPERTFQELQRLASESGRSLTEMIRIAIALAQVAVDEEAHGRKLAVINKDGQVLKEIIPLR